MPLGGRMPLSGCGQPVEKTLRIKRRIDRTKIRQMPKIFRGDFSPGLNHLPSHVLI